MGYHDPQPGTRLFTLSAPETHCSGPVRVRWYRGRRVLHPLRICFPGRQAFLHAVALRRSKFTIGPLPNRCVNKQRSDDHPFLFCFRIHRSPRLATLASHLDCGNALAEYRERCRLCFRRGDHLIQPTGESTAVTQSRGARIEFPSPKVAQSTFNPRH